MSKDVTPASSMSMPWASTGWSYTIWSILISSLVASAAVLPASMAAWNRLPMPYDVSMPHDLELRMARLCSTGMSTVWRIRLTTLLVLPGTNPKSTTQVGP